MEVEVHEKNTEKSTVCKESKGCTCGKPDQISWFKELDSEKDSQELLTFKRGNCCKVEKPGERDSGVLSRDVDGGNRLPNDSCENCSILAGLCPKREETRATICNEEAGSLKNVKTCDNVDTAFTAFTSSESKRRRSASESDSSGIESKPLRVRLSKKSTHKKPKTGCDDEATGKGKEIDSFAGATEVDSIPPSSRLSKENAAKKLKITFDSEAASKGEERDSFPESDSTDVDSGPSHTRMLKKNTVKKPESASSCSDEATGKRKGEDSINDPTDVDSIPLCALLSKNNTLKKPKIASTVETSGKEIGTDSITDATEGDSIPRSSRLSKRGTLKKVKTASGDEAACQRKGTDLIAVKIGDDNDFESPKAGRSAAGKRKGSDLSDDQDLLTSVFSTDNQTSSTSNREAKAGINSKKRKTKKAGARADVSERKVLKPAKKRITKRQMKSSNRTTAEILEGIVKVD